MEPGQKTCGLRTDGTNGKFPTPPGRSAGARLETEIEAVSHNPILDGLLEAVHGLVAVINENRQILALNDTMLKTLGVPSLSKVLGLRLGESLHCIHALRAPGGCGTSEYCPSCGAAIAQVVALTQQHSAEQLCALEVPGEDGHSNLFFRVRASPLTLNGQKYVLLFLQDVSQEQRAAILEQTFLHDLRNTSQGITMGTALLAENITNENRTLARDVMLMADRLGREIELQRCLASSSIKNFTFRPTPVSVDALFEELLRSCRHHPAQTGRVLDFAPPQPDHFLSTDLTILHRILYNMVINALEATEPGGIVRITAHRDTIRESFSVWNAGCIPPAIALRIFQRNFSTKGSLGHGLGTYSMKLLGEKLLNGHVSFTTSTGEGTSFTLELPV